MSKSFYNTNQEKGEELKESIRNAKSQEEIVLIFFKDKKRLTPSEAWVMYYETVSLHTPLTSIRRAITNLTSKDKLTKTEDTKIGIYGKNEHYYKFKY